jgi:stage II sporulation protein D
MSKILRSFILIFIVAFPANLFGHDGDLFRVSVLSLFKPEEVCVYSKTDELLILKVDDKPYYEYFVSKGGYFKISIEADEIAISLISSDGEKKKGKRVSANSSLGFITQDTKSLYNRYTIKVKDNLKKDYEGVLKITHPDESFLIVLRIGTKELVKAIVESEVGSYPAYEMLKVQALLTRTFLYANRGRHLKEGFDFCDTTHCQFYKEGSTGNEKVTSAVDDTKGEIITYNSSLISPYYFSTCGGHTTNINTVWGADDELYPYIKPVKCDYCSDSKFYRYQRRFKVSVLGRIFLGNGDKNFDINITKLDNNKHWVDTVTITAADHKMALKADKFKTMIGKELGWGELPSGAFTITKEREHFVINGNGLGHGIGLCQNGGNKMAATGADYKKIIGYYYYGVEIKNVTDL